MSLIVEEGTGLVNAESFASVAAADAYHSNFGNTGWTGSTGAKEIALRKATQYLETCYGALWKGRRLTMEQALSWPRTGVQDDQGFMVRSDIVPVNIVRATSEMALRALNDPALLPDQDQPGSITRDKIELPGPLVVDTTYAGSTTVNRIPLIDGLLAPYLAPGGGGPGNGGFRIVQVDRG